MTVLYLDMQGGRLQKDGGEYRVGLRDQEWRFPTHQVERVVLMGNIQLSTQVMAHFMEQSIPVSFLSSRGRYKGALTPVSHANVNLRMQQYDCVRDDARSLPLARWFVIGKIRNGKEMLCRKLKDSGIDSGKVRKDLKGWMDSAGRVQNMSRLRGMEGMAARTYFDAFTDVLKETPFQWQGRNRRPPKDPVNSMLSLGYGMLVNELISAIEVAGLDIHVGFLHGGELHSDYGKPSLALDMMEEFRYLVDRLVFRLLGSGEFDLNDFETIAGACKLKKSLRQRFFTEWETLMHSQIRYDHRRLAYRMIIAEQVALLSRVLLGQTSEYRPFMP